MALKKEERKKSLKEVYEHLTKCDYDENARKARLKVIDMLCEDGVFIIETKK